MWSRQLLFYLTGQLMDQPRAENDLYCLSNERCVLLAPPERCPCTFQSRLVVRVLAHAMGSVESVLELKEDRSVTDELRLTKLLSHRWFYDERFWLTEVTSLEQESVSALIVKSGKAQFRWREWCNHWIGMAPYQNWICIVFQIWLNSFRWGKEKCGAVVQVP